MDQPTTNSLSEIEIQMNSMLQHRYGGFYMPKYLALDTQTSETVVVYEHVWPFEKQLFTRPLTQFTEDRFRKATPDDLVKAMSKGEPFYKEFISNNKKKGLSCFDSNLHSS